ncbi:hypothetical protein, partial [Burkholderia cenocepacia]
RAAGRGRLHVAAAHRDRAVRGRGGKVMVAAVPGLSLPPLTFAGGSAGPSSATDYNPVSFNDGSFIVSGSPQLGTSIAGAVAGATNSFSIGSFSNLTPWLLIGGVAWLVMHRKRRD